MLLHLLKKRLKEVCRNRNGFYYAVQAFRFLEDIKYSSGELTFDDDLKICEELLDILRNLLTFSDCFQTLSLEVEYQSIANADEIILNKNLTHLSIIFNSNMVFFNDLKTYVSTYSSELLNDEVTPSYFYLYDDDVLYSDENVENKLENIRRATLWVNLFEKISDIRKQNEEGGSTYYLLVKGNGDSYVKPMALEVNDLSCVLDISVMPELGAFDSLLSEDRVNLNDDEKRSFFKLAMVDTLKELSIKENSKDYLELALKNIDHIKTSYFDHYEVFIHNFALGEFYKEVEGKYFDYVEKIQSVLGDIQTKIFAIPAALVGMGALSKVSDMSGNLLILLGVFLVSLMTVWLLKDQKTRLQQINSSMTFVFNKIRQDGEGHEKTRVMQDIAKMSKELDTLILRRRQWVDNYILMAWIPFIATLIAFVVKKWGVLSSVVEVLISVVCTPPIFSTFVCSNFFCV